MAQTGPNSAHHSQHAPQSVNGWQSDFMESLYAQYKSDPASVGPEWQNFFRGFDLGLKLDTEGHATAPITSAPQAAAAAAAAQTSGAAAAATARTSGAAAAATA